MTLRNLRPGLMAVGHGALWICDQQLPVVARVDGRSGEVLGLVSWPIVNSLRLLPSIADIRVGGDAVWVAAPNAGGLVRISPHLVAEPHVVPLGAPVGSLAAHGSTCWAREHSSGAKPDGATGPTVWRIRQGEVSEVPLGGYVQHIEATADGLLALMQRPGRTHVERPSPGAGTAWLYPGILARLLDGVVVEVIALEDLGGASFWVSGRRVWVHSGSHDHPPWLAEVDLQRSLLGRHIPLPSPVIGAAVAGDVAWVHTIDRQHRANWDRREVLACLSVEADSDLELGRAVVHGDIVDFVADRAYLWASRDGDARGERPPVRIDATTFEVSEFLIDVDLTTFLPRAHPPADLDPHAYAEKQRADLERRHVDTVVFERVFVQGEFPGIELVVIFVSSVRQGVRFARSWSLFDDFGNPQPLGYPEMELEEDIVAAGHGLPPLDRCIPDDQGLVWF